MTILSLLPFVAAFCGLFMALASLLRRKPTPAAWFFFAGMLALAVDSVFTGLSLRATELEAAVRWLTLSFIVKSALPFVWLCFSLVYSRGNYREVLSRWRVPLTIAALLPIAPLVFRGRLFRVVLLESPEVGWGLQSDVMAEALYATLVVAFVLILMNLEQTFRSAIGTMRWRIKFVVLALTVIFGTQIYVRIQGMLFSVQDLTLPGIESLALIIGCFFLALAYARTGLAEIDVYPSLAVLRSSFTVLIVGGYLFIVGVAAQIVKRFGGPEFFRLQAFMVLLGMTGLAVLLLSDRARQRLDLFVVRHFRKAQHDSVRIWNVFSRGLGSVRDQAGLCAVSARLISETFDVLSAAIWLLDDEKDRLVLRASTARQVRETDDNGGDVAPSAVTAGLRLKSSPFDLEDVSEPWAEAFRQLNSRTFPNGGNRVCVPLRAGEQCLGAIVLTDRVNGALYTAEELELLKCIGDQITSVLLNLRLASEVARARELDAFRAMSAFFVHDLKNAAASLNLMLKNLPVHFDDPAFREDALRGIGNTARRIDEMIARLTALREGSNFTPVEADLNQLVAEALDRVNGVPDVKLIRDLRPLPAILADREQIQSVVTNLVLNARDAVGSEGQIEVCTQHREGCVILSVADNGRGMSQSFINESLFRPFHSTKKKGLGIGLFQSRAVVQAHGGGMQVESEPGKGTTFRVSLPTKGRQ